MKLIAMHLKTCPFCGGTPRFIPYVEGSFHPDSARCDPCGYMVPVEIWQKRANDRSSENPKSP